MKRSYAAVLLAILLMSTGCIFDTSGVAASDSSVYDALCGDGTCSGQDFQVDGTNPCSSKVCVHGKCVVTDGGGAVCQCDTGWGGSKCDKKNPCIGSNDKICSGHGTCNNGKCTCQALYDGATCDKCASGYYKYPNCIQDPCSPNPCKNGGTCSNSTGSAVCKCVGNWDPSSQCSTCKGNRDIATNCTTCKGNWDIATNCTTCKGNWDPAKNCADCKAYWDKSTNCTSCITGYAGTTCNKCATGYCGYSTGCQPEPEIISFTIDCSMHIGCQTTEKYELTLDYKNATDFSAVVALEPGAPVGATPGSLSPTSGTLTGSPYKFSYTLGTTSSLPTKTKVTATVTHNKNPTDCKAGKDLIVNYN